MKLTFLYLLYLPYHIGFLDIKLLLQLYAHVMHTCTLRCENHFFNWIMVEHPFSFSLLHNFTTQFEIQKLFIIVLTLRVLEFSFPLKLVPPCFSQRTFSGNFLVEDYSLVCTPSL